MPSPLTVSKAFTQLQDIRDDWKRGESIDDLLAKIDAVGEWAGSQIAAKYTKKLDELCRECHQTRERLLGGSGKPGLRLF